MYYINKIIGAFLNPLGIGMLLLIAAVLALWWKRLSRVVQPLLLIAIAWLWFWSTGVAGRMIGLPLEREFPPRLAEHMPTADAIVILGGGIGENTNACPYAELELAADRVWHGARLYKAGKAPRVFVTCAADVRFMVDLGVPREAIEGPSGARNTEEEARWLLQALKQAPCGRQSPTANRQPTVLLVTSAWHMRRAKLLYDRYAQGVKVVPAAADHESMMMFDDPLEFKDFVPDPVMLGFNAYMFKEWIGYWGYKWLRK